jgi:signal peptidase II
MEIGERPYFSLLKNYKKVISMALMEKHKPLILALFSALLFDQATKLLACRYLHLGEPIAIIPNIFSLTLSFNRGAAFGVFSELPDIWRRLSLISASLIATLVVLVVYWSILKMVKIDKIAQVAVGSLLAGCISNHIIDRLRFDAAVDFLDFYWRTHHWPTFNVADSVNLLATVVLVLRYLRAYYLQHPRPKRT